MPKLKVIIVDDIFANRLLLSEILEDIGCEYVLAKNGKEAIDILSNDNYDLILMDIEMPVMNGLEATKYVREELSPPKCNIPIVALTAHNPKLFFDNHNDVGFTSLLTKPYSVAKIRQLLNVYLVESI